MKFLSLVTVAGCALRATAAPIDVEKRQLSGSDSMASLPSISMPALSMPTSSSGSTGGLGSLGGTSSGTSGLEGLSSGTGSSSSGLEGLTSGIGTSSSGTTGLEGLSSGTGTSLSSTATTKKRQTTSSFGSLTSGMSGSSSGLSGLGSSSSGLSSLGSLGTGTSGSTGSTTGSTTTGTTSTGTGTSSTVASGGCRALTLVFARGTGEMGTMGTVIGPPLATALASALGDDKVTAEGVDYPADAGGNANMGASGGPAMASQAQAALSSCPDTKLVLAGYSQGAMVVHNALSVQGLDGSTVAAIVAFGDPFNGQNFEGVDASKVKEFCGSSDGLCSSGGTTGTGSHLDYSGDADAAAQFIVGVVGL